MNHTRNFSIIAHIDAGKSTLADRLLEMTATVSPRDMQEQRLDPTPSERERGIPIKMAPVGMRYSISSHSRPDPSFPTRSGIYIDPRIREDDREEYTFNLIDTPGHVDFNYEVERALAACEGAVLLIDATKGVQDQTVANYHLAANLGLTVIPAINKIDANLADVPAATGQVQQLLNTKDSPLLISAKTGAGVAGLLAAVIEKIPPPSSRRSHDEGGLQALIFNSFFHPHLGVIAFVRLFSGAIGAKDQLRSISTRETFTPTEIGILSPDRIAKTELTAGSVGYLVTGQKDIRRVLVGDTITLAHDQTAPALPGFRHIKPNVYFDVFPIDNDAYQDLLDALGKLKLNDASLVGGVIDGKNIEID